MRRAGPPSRLVLSRPSFHMIFGCRRARPCLGQSTLARRPLTPAEFRSVLSASGPGFSAPLAARPWSTARRCVFVTLRANEGECGVRGRRNGASRASRCVIDGVFGRQRCPPRTIPAHTPLLPGSSQRQSRSLTASAPLSPFFAARRRAPRRRRRCRPSIQ